MEYKLHRQLCKDHKLVSSHHTSASGGDSDHMQQQYVSSLDDVCAWVFWNNGLVRDNRIDPKWLEPTHCSSLVWSDICVSQLELSWCELETCSVGFELNVVFSELRQMLPKKFRMEPRV